MQIPRECSLASQFQSFRRCFRTLKSLFICNQQEWQHSLHHFFSFESNQEMITFMENINKIVVFKGTVDAIIDMSVLQISGTYFLEMGKYLNICGPQGDKNSKKNIKHIVEQCLITVKSLRQEARKMQQSLRAEIGVLQQKNLEMQGRIDKFFGAIQRIHHQKQKISSPSQSSHKGYDAKDLNKSGIRSWGKSSRKTVKTIKQNWREKSYIHVDENYKFEGNLVQSKIEEEEGDIGLNDLKAKRGADQPESSNFQYIKSIVRPKLLMKTPPSGKYKLGSSIQTASQQRILQLFGFQGIAESQEI